MKKVLSQTEASFREKGSKFIGHLFPVDTKSAFEAELDQLKSQYPDANHHCYAWRMNPANIEKFAQDDGEPSGTAGLPILNQLKSFEVANAGLVVIRYYGGTNLGKSGLIKAYGGIAEACLQKALLQPLQLIWEVKIAYPYSEQNTIDQIMHQFDLKELWSSYAENVTLILGCPLEHKQQLNNRLKQLKHRGTKAEFLQKGYL